MPAFGHAAHSTSSCILGFEFIPTDDSSIAVGKLPPGGGGLLGWGHWLTMDASQVAGREDAGFSWVVLLPHEVLKATLRFHTGLQSS